MDTEIGARIERLHASLGRAIERDFSRLPAQIVAKPGVIAVFQDFSGGATEAQLSDALHSLIANVASFPDHLTHWGRTHAVSPDSVYNFFKASPDFCIVRDLWNNDKHGYRVMQLKTGGRAGSTAFMTMGKDGVPKVTGDGDAQAVLTGEIVDKLGNGLGEAHEYLERAIRLCEAALRQFGVTNGSCRAEGC
jgi:hypothetical protein